MFKIGDFSRLTLVSVKTLRYYDEIGLLKPVEVDRFTGYRYYSARQLPRLNRILALKDLGFSLEQIADLLNENLPAAELRGMFRLKKAEAEQQIMLEQERLRRIEARLTQIEREDKMPDHEVVIKKIEPIMVAGRSETISERNQIGPTLDRMFDEVSDYITRNGAKFAGPGIALWNDLEYKENDMHVGAACPFSGSLKGNDRIHITELPAVETMASLIHRGSFDQFPTSYQAITSWIEANGYQVIGPNREIYLEYERNGDAANYVTEIQFPVARA